MHNDFDVAAPLYDNIFTYSNIGKAQRKLVFKYLKPIISQGKKLSILELNCGTGADAIVFANMNHEVIATDISEGMIAVAKAKEHPKNLQFKVKDINTITSKTVCHDNNNYFLGDYLWVTFYLSDQQGFILSRIFFFIYSFILVFTTK